jgi:hypothetical protein
LLAGVVAGFLIAFMTVPSGASVYTSWLAVGVCGVAVGVWVMIRYGLLTLTVAIAVGFVLRNTPITLDLGAWYADQSLYLLAVIAGVATYGFFTARCGTQRSGTLGG